MSRKPIYVVQDEQMGRSFNIAVFHSYDKAKEVYEGRKQTRRSLQPTYGDLGCPVLLERVEMDIPYLALKRSELS